MAMSASRNWPSIDRLPRGGADASWLDRQLQTERLEFLDRDDVPEHTKRSVIRALDRFGARHGINEVFAQFALDQVADVKEPKILELGSGHGGLSRAILAGHPYARVTVTDVDPVSVEDIAASDLGGHPRAHIRVQNAAAIDAPDGSYDLVVFAQSFHHLPPAVASLAIAEATRVGKKFLIIDLARQAPGALLLWLPLFSLFSLVTAGYPITHDGFISSLRAYSPSALSALAAHASPGITLRFRRHRLARFLPPHQIVIAVRDMRTDKEEAK